MDALEHPHFFAAGAKILPPAAPAVSLQFSEISSNSPKLAPSKVLVPRCMWSTMHGPPKIPQDSPRFPFRTSTRSRLEALGPRAPLVFCFCFPPPTCPLQIAGPDTHREIKNASPPVVRQSDQRFSSNVNTGLAVCQG